MRNLSIENVTDLGRIMMAVARQRGFLQTSVFREVAEKNMRDTEMHNAFVVNANIKGYAFGDDERPERIIQAFFLSVAKMLHYKKVTDPKKAVAVILTDYSDQFKFAGVVHYNENGEGSTADNWEVSLMLTKEEYVDVKSEYDEVIEINCNDTPFAQVFMNVAYDIALIEFMGQYTLDAALIVIETLVQILDRESTDGPVEIKCGNYLIAGAQIEDNVKYYTLTADSDMKNIIKEDAAVENEAAK